MPARALKSVVLPVLGLPTSATVGVRTVMESAEEGMASERGDADAGSFVAAEAETVIAEANLHRIAERGEADDLDLLAVEQAHLHEPLHQEVVAFERFDARPLPGFKAIQRGHGLPQDGAHED